MTYPRIILCFMCVGLTYFHLAVSILTDKPACGKDYICIRPSFPNTTRSYIWAFSNLYLQDKNKSSDKKSPYFLTREKHSSCNKKRDFYQSLGFFSWFRNSKLTPNHSTPVDFSIGGEGTHANNDIPNKSQSVDILNDETFWKGSENVFKESRNNSSDLRDRQVDNSFSGRRSQRSNRVWKKGISEEKSLPSLSIDVEPDISQPQLEVSLTPAAVAQIVSKAQSVWQAKYFDGVTVGILFARKNTQNHNGETNDLHQVQVEAVLWLQNAESITDINDNSMKKMLEIVDERAMRCLTEALGLENVGCIYIKNNETKNETNFSAQKFYGNGKHLKRVHGVTSKPTENSPFFVDLLCIYEKCVQMALTVDQILMAFDLYKMSAMDGKHAAGFVHEIMKPKETGISNDNSTHKLQYDSLPINYKVSINDSEENIIKQMTKTPLLVLWAVPGPTAEEGVVIEAASPSDNCRILWSKRLLKLSESVGKRAKMRKAGRRFLPINQKGILQNDHAPAGWVSLREKILVNGHETAYIPLELLFYYLPIRLAEGKNQLHSKSGKLDASGHLFTPRQIDIAKSNDEFIRECLKAIANGSFEFDLIRDFELLLLLTKGIRSTNHLQALADAVLIASSSPARHNRLCEGPLQRLLGQKAAGILYGHETQ